MTEQDPAAIHDAWRQKQTGDVDGAWTFTRCTRCGWTINALSLMDTRYEMTCPCTEWPHVAPHPDAGPTMVPIGRLADAQEELTRVQRDNGKLMAELKDALSGRDRVSRRPWAFMRRRVGGRQ